MKKILFLCILFSFSFSEEFYKTRVFFNEDLEQPNPQCVNYFVNLVKTSSYDFSIWVANEKEQDKEEWAKEHLSFDFDTWNDKQIKARLYFHSKSKEFTGTHTLTWLTYDINTQTLQDSVQEESLNIDKTLAQKLNLCLKACDFSQTLALQNQYENSKIASLMENEITKEGRAYFYSSPNENCKIDDLFLIPKDKVNLLQNKGEFSFVVYKRKNGEIVKLWIKSDRIKNP